MGPFVVVTGDVVRTGGMDRANYALVEHLAREGADVHAVAYRVDEALRAMPNVRFHRVPKPANRYLLAAPLLATAGLGWARWAKARGGRAIVNGGNCPARAANWVHYVHAAYVPEVFGGVARRARVRASHELALANERRALRRATLVIANSERTKRDVIEKVGVAPERVHTVYYGIDASLFRQVSADERADAKERFGWPRDRPLVAFVGALGDRRKGFDVVFDAWKTLCASSSWDADLVVIGSGAELPAWKERAASVGIAGRVRFLGFRRDVPAVLAACDALASPNRYEAYGLAIQEALCTGLPCVISSTSGVAERYTDELTALLLDDPEDARGLVVRLDAWRAARAEFETSTRALASSLRARSWDDMAADVRRLVAAV